MGGDGRSKASAMLAKLRKLEREAEARQRYIKQLESYARDVVAENTDTNLGRSEHDERTKRLIGRQQRLIEELGGTIDLEEGDL